MKFAEKNRRLVLFMLAANVCAHDLQSNPEDPAQTNLQKLLAYSTQQNYHPEDVATAIFYSSDHQEGNANQALAKAGFDEMSPQLALDLHTAFPNLSTKAEVRAGDHIDGKETLGALRAFFGRRVAQFFSSKSDQEIVRQQTHTAIQKMEQFEHVTGIPIFPTIGNHGFYALYDEKESIANWIIERHGGLHHVAPLQNAQGNTIPLKIICCGAWADKKGREFLEKQFEKIKSEAQEELPVIVVTHYDEQSRDNQVWLSDSDIAALAKTFEKYGNIQEYAVGHGHDSDEVNWQPNGPAGRTYHTVRAGGNKKLVSLYDIQGNRLDTLFFEAHQNDLGTYEPALVEPVIDQREPGKTAWDDGIKRWWNSKVVNQWYPDSSCFCCR